MIARFRDWFVDGPLGITIAVGVVLGSVLSQLPILLISSFVIPVLVRWRYGNNGGGRLTFHVGGTAFDYTTALVYGLDGIIVVAVIYFVFVRRQSGPLDSVRDCPECMNEISAEARRCGFCTSPVEPVITRSAGGIA